MNSKLSLLIMAAGYGSRYGGYKQLETFGKKQLTIAEFNILNALKFGFNHFVFVIQRTMFDVFNKRLVKFLPADCKFDLVEQNIPEDFIGRDKPLGTGHAVLCAENVINNKFGVINADDFYGTNAMSVLAQALQKNSQPNIFYNVGFELKKTLSINGSVSRGVMVVDKSNYLIEINEITDIKQTTDGLVSVDQHILINYCDVVSMNLWGFSSEVFKILHHQFDNFKKTCTHQLSDEFYLPTAVSSAMKKGLCSVQMIKTTSNWCGVTYASDKKILENFLDNLK